jgi:hypothetical protein
MTKPINTENFKEATGRNLAEWMKYLRSISAEKLSHKEIAIHLQREAGLSGWWAQSVTVAYEQASGRRLPGQLADGTFSASISRRFEAERDALFEHWIQRIAGETKIVGQTMLAAPAMTRAKSSFNWRCKLADNSKVLVSFTTLTSTKTQVTVAHEGLATPTQVTKLKAAWVEQLAILNP